MESDREVGMFGRQQYMSWIAMVLLLAGTSGCVTVSHEELASRSHLDDRALASVFELETMIRVEVVALEEPEAEVGLASAR